jgi:hypothetical protein
MNARRALALAVGLLTLAAIQSAAATPTKQAIVALGAHRFGELRAPDATVARAGPNEVRFSKPMPKGGCGCGDGPAGPMVFHVARDGSTWVLDGLAHRLLVWRAGHAGRLARTVRLPRNLWPRDFALAPDGTIYLDAGKLYALTPAGRVRWSARTTIAIGNSRLLMGDDGILYTNSAGNPPPVMWTPLTTSAGRPLSLSAQRRRMSPLQPLSGGLRLRTQWRSNHDVRFATVDRRNRVVAAWRVTSRTLMNAMRAWPALVGGDLVMPLDVSRQSGKTFLWEHLILRLAPGGGVRQRFALDARAVWRDSDASIPLEVSTDGNLYQLRTNPRTGVRVTAYSLGPA